MPAISKGRPVRKGLGLVAAWAGILLLAASPCFSQARAKVKITDLAPQYQEWWRVVTYLITDKERDVFLQLPSDRDRDLFIDTFWKLRDPTPGTPQNEFKEEHLKRFQEANRRFHSGAGKEGWMTDRGRVYIILGAPISKSYHAGSRDLYPAEIWSYYGDVSKGMPTHFSLMFYQWRNVGEMKLYDPVVDTPTRLLVNPTEYDPLDYQTMVNKIYDLDPDIAGVALSIIPGEIPYSFQPSMDTELQLAAIMESPKKGLNDTYATHFLNYRGVVSTEYLTNYMSSEAEATILQDTQTGLTFCDFAVSPERLSMDLYEPKEEYSTDFQIDVSLRSGDKVILQYTKDYPMTIPAANLSDTKNMGVSIADSFPVIEGKYKLTVLLRNTVGKEFSTFERDIEVPAVSGPPRLSAPSLGTRLVSVEAGAHVPFWADGKKLNVDPKRTFVSGEEVSFLFSVSGLTEGLCRDGSVGVSIKGTQTVPPAQKTYSVPLSGRPPRPATVIAQTLVTSDLPPDYYELTLTLKDGQGRALDTAQGTFVISPVKALPHPIVVSKALPLANAFMLQYALAYQYEQTGQNERAEAAYKKALALRPAYKNKIPEYALFLIKSSKYNEALTLLDGIQTENNLKFQYYYLRGRALMGLEQYPAAAESFRQGNMIYNSDAGLLAGLGTALYKSGKKDEALAALKASLSLNSEQKDVKDLIQLIEGKK